MTQAPTLSQTWTEFVEVFGLVVPAGADAVSVTVPWVPAWLSSTPVWAARPEPVSLAVQVNETVPLCQLVSADGQVTVGNVLSILTPVIGPAVTQVPTLLQTWTEFVEAIGLVAPAGADAVSVTVAWVPAWLSTTPAWPGPGPTGVGHRARERDRAGGPVGARRRTADHWRGLSIMNPEMAGIGVQFPTLSQSCPDDVEALEFAVPAGTDVLNLTLPVLDVPPAMPDCVSLPVQVTLWSVENQLVGATAGVHRMLLGAVPST